jgi:hypothetical protein
LPVAISCRVEESTMAVWTLVVGVRPTYAFAAHDAAAARRRLEDEGLKDDLSYYEDADGDPLWDGEDALSVRPATPDERRAWRKAQERRREDFAAPRETRRRASYLVSVHDPADDDVLSM